MCLVGASCSLCYFAIYVSHILFFFHFFSFFGHNCDKLSEIINLQRGIVYLTPRVGGSSPQSAEVCAVSSTLVSSSSWQERIANKAPLLISKITEIRKRFEPHRPSKAGLLRHRNGNQALNPESSGRQCQGPN